MAARDVDALRAHIHAPSVGPSVRAEPGELSDAIDTIFAEIFAETEAATYSLHARRYLGQADASWLDAHGKERGVVRLTGESDADYRVRIGTVPEALTKPGILARVDEILLVGTSRMDEWPIDGMFTDIQDRRGFSEMATVHNEPRGFTVYISEQLANRSDRGNVLDVPANPWKAATGITYCFAGNIVASGDSYSHSMFADDLSPTRGAIYSEIYQLIDGIRAGGLGPPPHFTVEIE